MKSVSSKRKEFHDSLTEGWMSSVRNDQRCNAPVVPYESPLSTRCVDWESVNRPATDQ
jgi:hypothetical protein